MVFFKWSSHVYTVRQIIIKKTNADIYNYCQRRAELAYRLYNAALFRIRQIFTGFNRESLNDNQKQVFAEIKALSKARPDLTVKQFIGYRQLEKMMRITGNPDFFAGLPAQTSQAMVRHARQDFNNWLSALKDFKKNPSKYLGKPKMPHYKKVPCCFTITNQDAVIFYRDKLKLPGTKFRVHISDVSGSGPLKEVKVIPYYGRFILSLTFKSADQPLLSSGKQAAGIDFGIDNFAAIVATDGSSRLYKGGAVLSENRMFAKKRAKAVSLITRGRNHVHASSRYLQNLSYHHANFNRDQLHKISRSIVGFCIKHEVGTLVLGENKLWKQESNMGKINNQKFVQMPIGLLKQMIEYKAAQAGIRIISQEESYTSKASFLDNDRVPVYGKNDAKALFSGKRISRGLYRSKDGTVINADLNGAANILKKAITGVWEKSGLTDFKFLNTPEVYGFHKLNP